MRMTCSSCEAYLERRLVLALTLLLLVTAAVYSGSLGNGFVWDDNDVIVRYPLNRSLSNLPQFLTASDSISGWPAAPYYRPLARASYALDYQIFGLRPWGYHLENLLLHLANVLLLFFAGRLISKETLPALLGSAMFAVHPAISEPVFAAFARNTLLADFFALAAFLAFHRGVQGRSPAWSASSALLLLLGLLSKETAIVALPVAAWYCYSERLPVRQAVLRLLPLAVAGALYLLLRSNALAGVLSAPHAPTLHQRMLHNVYRIPRYLLLLIAPARLTVLHEIPGDLSRMAPLLAASWAAIAVGAAALWRYAGKEVMFGLVWGVCALVPVMGVVALPGAPLAERHLYIPCAGFALAGGVIAAMFIRKYAVAGMALLCAMLLLFMSLTFMRGNDWRDDATLFRRAVEVNPGSVTAHYNLGNAYLKGNDPGAALKEWLQAVRLDPYASDALYQVGTQLLSGGRYQEAQHYLERAVAVQPSWFYARSNLAVVLDMQDKREEAMKQYEAALMVVPPERSDSIPALRERIAQLRSNERSGKDRMLIQREMPD